MKKRKFPKNTDCPLNKYEKVALSRMLDELEWKEYQPFKHQSGGFASAEVYRYSEVSIGVELKYGVEGQGNGGVVYTADFDINRLEMLICM